MSIVVEVMMELQVPAGPKAVDPAAGGEAQRGRGERRQVPCGGHDGFK